MALRSGALSTGQNLRACQNGRAPAPAPPACRCPLRGPGRPLRRAPGPALDLSSWKSWEHSPDTSALDSPILAQSRRDAHLNTRSGAADRSQRWRRSAETAEIDRDGRSRRICGAGGRKWGIWRWVVTPSWSMRARGAPPDRPRGPVRREQWIKTFVLSGRDTLSARFAAETRFVRL